LAELQRASRERVEDKQSQIEGLQTFAKNQAEVVQTAQSVVAVATKANKLRELLKSS
jgi:hypothetical protein